MSSPLHVSAVLTRTQHAIAVHLAITNASDTAITGVVLSNAAVGGRTASPLPLVVGSVRPGTVARITVTVPLITGAAGTVTSLSASGISAGGTFGLAERVALP